jgi:thioredoxin reductase (NADPH)
LPRPERRDVLIVGAGVAGLSAALWLRDFGLDALLLEEATQPGGQLHEIHAPIPNYLLGFNWAGPRFAAVAVADARAASLQLLAGEPVRRISARGCSLTRGEGRNAERLGARALLIATGLRRRRLGVPGETALFGRGVSHSANQDRQRHAGTPVTVIGGGTAAVEDALLCAETGSDVTLLHRSGRFRARSDFLARAKAHPKIRLVVNATVTEIVGKDHVEAVRYRARGSRAAREIAVAAVFVRIGWEPRTELLQGQLPLDRAGYVKAGSGGATAVPGVYAAGDVCSPRWPSIANAAGQGAAAAWEIARLLGRVRE